MTAANPSIAAQALDNYGSLGFRLRVYAVVLPVSVACAVVLEVGLGVPTATVALIGAAFSILLLLTVPVLYTARQRKAVERTQIPQPEHAESMYDLWRTQAALLRQYHYHLDRAAEFTPEEQRRLLDNFVRLFEVQEYLYKLDPRVDLLVELDRSTSPKTVAPLADYLDYLGAMVKELDPEPQHLLQVVGILESLNRTAAERWELEPRLSAVYRRALHDIAQALNRYLMEKLVAKRQAQFRVFRERYAREHGRSYPYGTVVDPHGLFDPKRKLT